MKRITLVALLAAATALSGCVVVPAHSYYGREYRGDRDGRDYRYRDRDRYYYNYRRDGDRAGGWAAP